MKPKQLNIYEMWELYKLLGKGMGQSYLLNEIIEMLKSKPPQDIKKSMILMYGKMPSSPLELAVLFTNGLKKNNFFEFQLMMEKLS